MKLNNIVIKPNAINLAIYAAQGDIGSVIAHQKFIEVRNTISFGNIAIEKAIKTADNISKYISYRSAILDYNSCYDYILQIIYFGFDFCSRIDSQDSYIRQMKNGCRKTVLLQQGNGERIIKESSFWNKVKELKQHDLKAKDFFGKMEQLEEKLREPDVNISEWANNIKHQGGLVVEELLNRENTARITIKKSENDELIFDLSDMYILSTFNDIEGRLSKQNELIVGFLNYLQDVIFGDTHNWDLKVSQKLFSANGYDKEEYKGTVSLTSFETAE